MTVLWQTGVLLATGFVAAAATAAPREPLPASAIVQFQSPPKPTGPIAVDYRLVGQPVVGQALDVVITARSSGAVGLALEASVADPAALVVTAQTSTVDRGGERTWVVTVVPTLSRSSHLNLLVTGEIDGVAQARGVVIPIHTGVVEVGGEAPVDDASVGSGGENLILLPVDERP